jgi:hypothetical protein
MGEIRIAYKIFVGKSERKKPLGRPRRRWREKIRMDLREIEGEDVDWMHLAQDKDHCRAPVNTVMKLRVPQKAWNFLIS